MNPPWKEAAQSVLEPILFCRPLNEGQINLCIAAFLGLSVLEDCPAPYRRHVADLRLDGVWGPTAESTVELMKRLIDS